MTATDVPRTEYEDGQPVLRSPRKAIRLPKPFAPAEFELVSDAAEPDVRALCVFLRETGLRAAEALSITAEQARAWPQPPWWCRRAVCPKHSASVRIIGKGDKERPIVLTRRALLAARVMLDVTKGPSLVPWQRRTMQRRLEHLSAITGIHVHAHRFRHSHLTELVESGVPIHVTADVAGHANINVTRRYYFASESARRAALGKRGRWLRKAR